MATFSQETLLCPTDGLNITMTVQLIRALTSLSESADLPVLREDVERCMWFNGRSQLNCSNKERTKEQLKAFIAVPKSRNTKRMAQRIESLVKPPSPSPKKSMQPCQNYNKTFMCQLFFCHNRPENKQHPSLAKYLTNTHNKGTH